MNEQQPKPKKGVITIITLCILILIVLVGVSFAIYKKITFENSRTIKTQSFNTEYFKCENLPIMQGVSCIICKSKWGSEPVIQCLSLPSQRPQAQGTGATEKGVTKK